MPPGLKSILVVDDEPALLKMVSVYLERAGYSVVTCLNAEIAVAALERAPAEFSIAVIDGSLPGPGVDVLAGRLLRANPELRVIVDSGYPLDMTAVEAVAPGRSMFLQKPFTSEMLTEAVRRMIGAEETSL